MAKIERHPTNGWFPAKAFLQVMQVMHNAATQVHTHWLGHSDCKYVSIYVDQRTGDFILRDRQGNIIENDVLFEMFPSLRD